MNPRKRQGPCTLLGLAALVAALGAPGSVRAQDARSTLGRGSPEATVAAFFDGVGELRWEAVAASIHDETLELFRFHVTSMLDADDGGAFASVFGADAASIRSWPPDRLFAQLLEAVYDRVPGLLQIMATNTYEYLGHVPEDPDLAHVIARVTPYTDGSAPTRITTVTVRRSGSGWLVLSSPELDAISTAMRGLAFRPGDGCHASFD